MGSNGKHVGIHLVHLFSAEMEQVFFSKKTHEKLVIALFAKSPFVNDSLVFANGLKTTIQVQGIVSGFNFRFYQIEFLDFFVGKQILDKLHAGGIGSRCYIIFVIAPFIGPNKNIILPQHHVPSFYVYRFGRTNHLQGIDLVNNVLDGLLLALALGQNIRSDENVSNHETNVPHKYLVVVRYGSRTKNGHAIIAQNLPKSFHFQHHVLLQGISACQDVLQRFGVIGILDLWGWSIAGCRAQDHGAQPRSFVMDV